jgi:hypothetical protein
LIGSFLIYFELLGLPLPPFGSLWGASALPWGALGLLWDPLGPPWDALGILWGTLGSLGMALGSLGVPLGVFWATLGDLGVPGAPPQKNEARAPRLRTRSNLGEFARRSRRSGRNGVIKCCWDPPSTRAGGQDYTSFTNSPNRKRSTAANSRE